MPAAPSSSTAAAAPAEPLAPPDQSPQAAASSPAAFNQLLAKTLGTSHSATAGHVQLIGLERLRDYLGADWASEKEKVHAAADAVIRNHLLKGDMHRQIDDISYVVLFSSLAQDAARLKCALIADAIVKRLIGSSEDLSFVNIRTAVLKEDGKVIFQKVTDLESLVQHMVAQAPDDLEEPSSAWPAADLQNRRRRLEWCLRTVTYRYQPLWCVARGSVFLYRILPIRPSPSGKALTGYRLLPQPDDPDAMLELDLRCAGQAVQELARTQESGLRHLIGLRLHFESVASIKRRLRLVAILQKAPEHLRQNLICSIVDVPVGVSQTKLNDIVGGLRSFFRLTTATLSSPNTDLRLFADAKIYAVGVAVPAATGLLTVAGLEMRRFCKEAQRVNLRTYLNNLSNPTLVRHALALGFDYIDGDAIAGTVERPAGIFALSAADVVA